MIITRYGNLRIIKGGKHLANTFLALGYTECQEGYRFGNETVTYNPKLKAWMVTDARDKNLPHHGN